MDNEIKKKKPELLIGAKYQINLKNGGKKEMFFCEVKPLSWMDKDSDKLYFFRDKPIQNWLGYHHGTMIKYDNIGEMVALAYHEEYLKQKENSKQSAMARADAMGKTIYVR